MKKFIKDNLYLIIIIIIALALRCYKLDFQSMWIDEIFSVIQADPKNSFAGIYSFLKATDPHPPLYYFSLKVFFTIFGYTSFAARLFSALLGIAGILALYGFSKELFNKRVGLIASILIAVNWFHLFYSQEARMYSMLFLTTIISFHGLVIFIKRPAIKTALIYAILTLLMIYTQFFALFTLISQCFILLYFIIRPYRVKPLLFFKYCLIAGVTIALLYLPALFIFLQTFKRTSIWIQLPGLDVFTYMFREFFGFNESVLFIINIAVLFFILKLFKRIPNNSLAINPEKEKQVFSVFLLTVWVVITLLIPLISSYVNLPMIVNRYFINILPAIIIVIAAGIYYIQNRVVQTMIVVLFVVFSLTDIFIVKDYYNKPTKSQFRELANVIKEKNYNDTPVVAYWSWLIPYYFRDSEIQVKQYTFKDYIKALQNNEIQHTSFWYMDGNSRPYDLSDAETEFLNKNYILKEKLDYVDAWAYHYEYIHTVGRANDDFELKKKFKGAQYDNFGNIALYSNSTLITDFFNFKEGKYKVILSGTSLPEKPIDNVNAHLMLKANGNILADIYLSPDASKQSNEFEFIVDNEKKLRFQIIYDNDLFKDGKDRNAIINSIKILKVN